jgi:hypothetical protein
VSRTAGAIAALAAVALAPAASAGELVVERGERLVRVDPDGGSVRPLARGHGAACGP